MIGSVSDPSPVSVITGSSRGVGRALAEHLLSRGHRVVGLARSNGDLQADSYRHLSVDIGDASAVQTAFRVIKGEFGGIDHLVNNAGVLTSQRAMVLDPAAAKAMIDINLFGTFMVSREAARLMRRRPHGRIVTIGSMAAALQPVGDSIYAATKAAIGVLSNVLAKELGPMGITSNMLSISAIETDMMQQIPRDQIDRIVAALPVPRLATIADVTNALDFFLSPASDYVTGQTLWLGGLH